MSSHLPISRCSSGLQGHNQDKDTNLYIQQEDMMVYLSWEDLWVTLHATRGNARPILQGLTGYAQPGEVLAIMGPSGCGKSTLLDALAGRLGSTMRQHGCVMINGREQVLAFGTSAYVTQEDILMTTLTVKEAVYYSAELQLPNSMSKLDKWARADMIIKEMGLQSVRDTRIGGGGVKGISGGQKRRVSVCIEILPRPKLLFLDEPTSGLDSAASYHVMKEIVSLARRDGLTIVASIHQPSGEVFDFFDNVCLLSSGLTVYFGPTSLASEFFSSNGFPCPYLRNPSDHYLRTINKDFDIEIEGCSPTTTSTDIAITHLVKSYKGSNILQQVQNRISEIHSVEGPNIKRGSQSSFITQCIVLSRRSYVNMFRDPGYYWLRFAIYIALCLCIGILFHNIGHDYGSIQARGSMLMFVSAFLTFMTIGGFPSFVEGLKIFYRERLNGHYGVVAFIIGNTISSTPYLALISVIPASAAYYLVGLQSGPEHFFFFALVLFISMALVESLMMIIASMVPNYLLGIIAGAGVQGAMMLFAGFFRLPNSMPKPFCKYPMHYIAFQKYVNQGYYKNEFYGLEFPSNKNGVSTITGIEVVRDYWEMEVSYSKWVDLAVLCGMVILYRFLFLVIVKVQEQMRPIIRISSKVSFTQDTEETELSSEISTNATP